jgi:ankyrin repeat protein
MERLQAMVTSGFDPGQLYDSLGLSQVTTTHKDYGIRGRNVVPTPEQVKAVKTLASRLKLTGNSHPITTRSTTGGDGELHDVEEEFDILSKDRIILHEGEIQKRSLNSLVQHQNKRRLFLMNDVLLITTPGFHIRSAGENYKLNEVFTLEEIKLVTYLRHDEYLENGGYDSDVGVGSNAKSAPTSPAPNNDGTKESDESANGFIIITKERPYHFITSTPNEKRIWVEELTKAILSYNASKASLTPGWEHDVIQGSLISASMKGDINEVRMHLDSLESEGLSVDETDEYAMTALHWASLQGNVVNVAALVDSGAYIDSLNNGLNSPLLLAAAAGHVDVFIYLVDKGADLYTRNLRDQDALFMMVMHNRNNRNVNVMLDLLVKQGIEVDTPDASGSTALYECARTNLSHSIAMLASVGANVNLLNQHTGVTPLQACCANSKPDAETIRTLLDCGAHPNPIAKDDGRAMDMVLDSFFARYPNGIAEGDAMDMDVYADFAMNVLPVLMEIAKKGGKYSPEKVTTLRKSLIEAIESAQQHWADLKEPSDLLNYVDLDIVDSNSSQWSNDNSSATCLMCTESTFSIMIRRHHCRLCGILCCHNCSIKRCTGKDGETLRCCDSCFNRILHDYASRQTEIARSEKHRRKTLEALETAQQKALNNKKKGFFEGLFGSNEPNSAVKATASSNNIKDTTSEIMNNLQERGEKLEQLNEKSEAMENAAADFKNSTAELLRQTKAQSFW